MAVRELSCVLEESEYFLWQAQRGFAGQPLERLDLGARQAAWADQAGSSHALDFLMMVDNRFNTAYDIQ